MEEREDGKVGKREDWSREEGTYVEDMTRIGPEALRIWAPRPLVKKQSCRVSFWTVSVSIRFSESGQSCNRRFKYCSTKTDATIQTECVPLAALRNTNSGP